MLAKRRGVPLRTAHIWSWFAQLCRGRQATSEGMPLPIPYCEIEAWARLCREEVRPFEVHLLKRLDMLYLSVGG